jgi:cadmium resistance protein CadD (predicted permease)
VDKLLHLAILPRVLVEILEKIVSSTSIPLYRSITYVQTISRGEAKMETLTAIISAIAIFAAINLDNIFIIMTLFSQIDSNFRKFHIVIGQFIGTVVLMILTLFGTLVTFHLFHQLIALLGIIPIYMGVKSLIEYWRNTDSDSDDENELLFNDRRPSNILNRNTFKVTSIAIASCFDDIGVYVSLFSNSTIYQIIVSIIVVFLLVGLLCYVSYKLITQPLISKVLKKYGRSITPFILIGLGVYILFENM